MKKAAGKKNGWKERVFSLVANKIDAIAENAILVENHAEVLHKNPKIQGVHIFALPVEMDGGLWRIQLLVKDVNEARNERTTIHTIDGIEIYKMENPPVGITQSEGGVSYVEGIAAADNRQVRNVTENGPNDHTVSLSQLLGGDKPYIRQDGKGFFDSVDDASRAEGGVYYEPREYNQIIGDIETRYNEAIVRDFDGNIVPLSKRFNSRKWEEFYQVGYHGTPYFFDAFTLAHIGSGEGAQAHGQYFALSKRTPEDYARRLSSWIDDVQLLKLFRSLKKTGATPLLRHRFWEPLFWCGSKFPIFSTSFPVQFM